MKSTAPTEAGQNAGQIAGESLLRTWLEACPFELDADTQNKMVEAMLSGLLPVDAVAELEAETHRAGELGPESK